MADEKTHKRQAKPWNYHRRQEKAEYFFLVYEQMGATRTLKRLWGLLRGVGVKISLKTLEEYSAEYTWQAKLLERAARAESANIPGVQEAVEAMNQEHVQVFKDLGALVTASIKHYKAQIAKNNEAGLGEVLTSLSLADVGRLAEVYQRGERLARGEATSKAEVVVQVVAPLVKDIMAVFFAVNVITNDPPELVRRRQAEFVKRGDQVLMTYYGRKQITEGKGVDE